MDRFGRNRKRFYMIELIFQVRASRRLRKMLCLIDQNSLWSPIFQHLLPGPLQGGGITHQARRHMPAHPFVKDWQDRSSFHFVVDEWLRDRHERTRVKVWPAELSSRGSHGIQFDNWHRNQDRVKADPGHV